MVTYKIHDLIMVVRVYLLQSIIRGNEGEEEAPSGLTPGDHRSPGGVLQRIIP